MEPPGRWYSLADTTVVFLPGFFRCGFGLLFPKSIFLIILIHILIAAWQNCLKAIIINGIYSNSKKLQIEITEIFEKVYTILS